MSLKLVHASLTFTSTNKYYSLLKFNGPSRMARIIVFFVLFCLPSFVSATPDVTTTKELLSGNFLRGLLLLMGFISFVCGVITGKSGNFAIAFFLMISAFFIPGFIDSIQTDANTTDVSTGFSSGTYLFTILGVLTFLVFAFMVFEYFARVAQDSQLTENNLRDIEIDLLNRVDQLNDNPSGREKAVESADIPEPEPKNRRKVVLD